MVNGADRFTVTAEWGANKFLKPRDWQIGSIYETYEAKTKEKALKLESFKVVGEREDFWNRYIKTEAIISGSPIAPAVIAALIALITAALYVLAIWLVGKEIIQPIAKVVEPVAEKAPEALAIGGAVIIGLLLLFLIGFRAPKRRD